MATHSGYFCLENPMARGAWWATQSTGRKESYSTGWMSTHRSFLAPLLLQPIGLSFVTYSSIQSLSPGQLFATPWTAAHQASLSITNSKSLIKLMSVESMMPSNHIILCHLLLLLPSIFPSISLFQWISFSYQVAKVLEFQLQHQFFQRIFRTDFL